MDASPQAPDALTRLTPLGERGTMVAIIAGLALSFFSLAFFLVYWRNGDMDLIVVYNALAVNNGKPQLYFDHPGHLLIVLTAAWFRLLHALGLLQHAALSSMPPASNVAAFDAALTEAVRAGRVLAFVLGIGAILSFAALMRGIVRDQRIVLVATFAIAFSGGIAIHIGRLRTELISAGLAVAALMILIRTARRATSWRPAIIGLAALLCAIGLTSKVHAILLIAAFPVLLLPFGTQQSESVAPWRSFATASVPIAAFAVAAASCLAAALPLIAEGLDARLAAAIPIFRFLGLPFGAISALLIVWLVAGMIAFAKLWRVSAAETLAAVLAIAAGAALGLLVLWAHHHPFNSVAVINPLERMLSYAMFQPDAKAEALGASFLSDIAATLARYTFVLGPSSRPAIFLVWLIVPALAYAWPRDRQVALQAIALIVVAFGLDTLGMRRGLKAEYWIFTDPLIVIAGALLLKRFAGLRHHRLAFPAGLALIVATIGVGQSGPVRTALLRAPPQPICEWNQAYLPLMPLPFCPQ